MKICKGQKSRLLHCFAVIWWWKQGGYAADCGNPHNAVHNSWQQTATAKDKCNKVKVQKPDKSPVKPADNQQGDTKFIHHNAKINPFSLKAAKAFLVYYAHKNPD